MRSTARLLPFFLLTLVLAPPAGADGFGGGQGDLDPYAVADPAAPPVTAKALPALDRFWPYHVQLTEPFTLPGAKRALGKGVQGVMIRVEPTQVVRIDFGRDGVQEVPIAKTDVVARAEAIRKGEATKKAANFVLAISPRMLDPRSPVPSPVGPNDAGRHPAFLAVYADPGAEGFEALAKGMAPLDGQQDVPTVFFPQGDHEDPDVAASLRGAGWPSYYVRALFVPSYTSAHIGDDAELPTVVLVTRDGRVLHRGPWSSRLPAQLRQTLSREFGEKG